MLHMRQPVSNYYIGFFKLTVLFRLGYDMRRERHNTCSRHAKALSYATMPIASVQAPYNAH